MYIITRFHSTSQTMQPFFSRVIFLCTWITVDIIPRVINTCTTFTVSTTRFLVMLITFTRVLQAVNHLKFGRIPMSRLQFKHIA